MFENKTILVTGGTGTLGYAIVERLLTENPKEIRIISRNEEKQVTMAQKYPMIKYYLGSVENVTSLEKAVAGCDVIFHCAAMKHIDIAERQPYQTVITNILGSLNVIQLAVKYGVGSVVGISTDKACAAVGVYGMTKRIMEYLFLWANLQSDHATAFYVVRFGNLFGSTGSVVDKWYNAGKDGEKLKVTNPEMTRFYFSANDAANLIWAALGIGDYNAIYSARMWTLKTGRLAEIMQSNGIEIIGNREGERDYECLISAEEMDRTETIRYTDGTLDVFKIGQNKIRTNSAPYTSDTAPQMDDREIVKLLNGYKKKWRVE